VSGSADLGSIGPVLVANRGEIAVRVLRTAHSLGLGSVAVFSAADARSPHPVLADRAVRIGSYLDPDELLAAAARTGARSVHPGYGFLSENAGFAAAVGSAGLRWIGPPPEAIELMGDKARAKRLAAEAGVPIIPGSDGDDAGLAELRDFAGEHGLPVLVKAVAGGGGRGMRVVETEGEMEEALASARREAEAAFGDGRVLIERYFPRPRHIEIQLLADGRGGVVHLGERECSLQRRHQKVIEEAPSPAIDASMRERLGEAAKALALACGYAGAGTVEFLLSREGDEFFFLEMNTRLQVEHPVTELVWGIDLVEEQLRVAAGEPLRFAQDDLAASGHAAEARLYAEDPARGFLPAAGTVRRWQPPTGPGLRTDAGIVAGSVVGTDYDPMLAKLIAHGPDRPTALRRLDRALAGLELLGVAHTAAFSRRLLALPEVRAGDLDTGLLERELATGELDPPFDLLAAAAAALFLRDTAGDSLPPGPWRRELANHGEVSIRDGVVTTPAGSARLGELRHAAEGRLTVELDGELLAYALAEGEEAVWVSRAGHVLEAAPVRRNAASAGAAEGSLEAPMPGKVLSVAVANGDRVAEGELLLVLESMKMELQITAPHEGTVAGLELGEGDGVTPGQPLVAVEPGDDG
jgi:acetyl-CoA/propionyl-CoA carboxylase, biotin carboxylase, biotin carboxyl carrier protein